MLTSPEPGSSQSSTQVTSRASQSGMQGPSPTYFTFYDMDDTSIDLNTNLIKNPHLLLPIMLFQTYAPNQHLGIMTNRNPQDNETDYSVHQYVIDLSRFGINIPPSQIIFGGGQNNHPATRELHELQAAIDILNKQLKSLDLTAGPMLSAKIRGAEAKSHFDQLIEAKFTGKNFHINTFLNAVFNHETEQYDFEKGSCPQNELVMCLVDDLDKIASVASYLGHNFIGIKASRGGKRPAELEFPIEKDDFYEDNYLFDLANHIGLADYAERILSPSFEFKQRNVMIDMAALLYAWQAFPGEVKSESFVGIIKHLSPTQLEQMANLLAYIQTHSKPHPDAHYRPVDKIAGYFRYAADEAFLKFTAAEMLMSLRQRILTLSIPSMQPPVVEETLPESSRPRKILGSLFKSRSVTNTLKSPRVIVDERTQELAQLRQEEQALIGRIAEFLKSQDLELASQAQKILGTMLERGEEALPAILATFPSLSSSSSSSSSSTSSSSSAPLPATIPIPASPHFPGLSRHRVSSSPTSPRPGSGTVQEQADFLIPKEEKRLEL